MGASRVIFLSHSGADTDAARDFCRRLLASPDAQAAGLKVWFDKDGGLRPGQQWQPQIEQAIAQDATAFVVYVGSLGIINWVDMEVQVALTRAVADKSFLFIPVFAPGSKADAALPRFAKLYQGVRDPEELDKLLKAVLNLEWDTTPKLIDEPFVGLRSMSEEESDRFFGRSAEIAMLVEKFDKHRIVAIVADSGTGKSSLAKAGFAPAFRGGALFDRAREDAREKVWNVVTMRPRADPLAGLRQGVTETAEKLGRSLDERASLRKPVSVDDAGETAFALQCGLPSAKTSTLLIVDQCEELFTTTPGKEAAAFASLLVALADSQSGVRVLLTVRADYFNLASGVKDASGKPTLFHRLTADNNAAILRLKAMSAEGIKEAVCKPLKLAGEGDEAANKALLEAVQSDISQQASDLPLLQVALRAAWHEHKATKRPMLECYQSVGRVSGALAREANKARERLPKEDQDRLESIFVRLVRLGDTGGATRRPAQLDEFDPARKAVLQQLGSGESGWLVSVSEKTAELSHEALITQWPWLQDMLKADAADVRPLERLMERAKEWSVADEKTKGDYVVTGAEYELLSDLATRRPEWLSSADTDFIKASNDQRFREQRREWWMTWLLRSAAAAIICALVVVGWLYLMERAARNQADAAVAKADAAATDAARQKATAIRELGKAIRNETVALNALASFEADKQPVNAAKMALAGWPRQGSGDRVPMFSGALDALGKSIPNLRERRLMQGGRSASLSPDGTRIVMFKNGDTAQILDAATGRELAALKGHDVSVISADFSPDGTRVVTAAYTGTVCIWDAATGRELATLVKGHGAMALFAAFSPDGARVVTTSDYRLGVWDAATGRELTKFGLDVGRVNSAAFSPDGTRVVTSSGNEGARVWNAATGGELLKLEGHNGRVNTAVFNQDGTRIVTASSDETARVWDAATGDKLAMLTGHGGSVISAAFSPDGKRIVTASADKTARVWDAATGRETAVLEGHADAINSAAFGADGASIVTGSDDKTIRFWDVATASEIAAFKEDRGRVAFAAFSPDGTHLVTVFGISGRVWDVATGREIATFVGHEPIWSASLTQDGTRVVTASFDKTARVWDAATGRELAALKGHSEIVNTAVFSPDGARVVTTSFDKTARVWDAATGRQLALLKGHAEWVNSAAFNSDGSRIVTASADGTARVWDAVTGGQFVALNDRSPILSASFSRDGTRVVTASLDATARVWDAATGREIAVLKGHEGALISAAFSLDGARVLTASYDKTARLWNAGTGREIATLRGHEDKVQSAAFSPDGTRVITASSDKTARVWDAATGRELAVLKGHANEVISAAFSHDGSRIVTASDDGTARIWDVSGIPKGNILQVACAYLRMHENPVSLEGVTDYPFTFDRPICETDPPPPDPETIDRARIDLDATR